MLELARPYTRGMNKFQYFDDKKLTEADVDKFGKMMFDALYN